MKLIIDISEKDYRNFVLQNDNGVLEDTIPSHRAKIAIANGTPLPKGHGRLIDADEYLAENRPRGILDELLWTESEMYKRIQRMPTIVGADKEGAEE